MLSSLSRWFRGSRTVGKRHAERKPRFCKLHLEALEDRTLLSGGWAFAVPIGNSSVQSNAVDAAGNVYVTGSFNNTVDFDPGPGIYNLTAASLSLAPFVAKYAPDSSLLWARQPTGATGGAGWGLSVDAGGNVTVAGSFQGSADFDPGAGTASLNSAGGNDIFVWKLDTAGNLLWVRQAGSTGDDQSRYSTSDAAGNVYVAGLFTGTVDFDPGLGVANLTSAGGSDIFVWKLDANGNFGWAQRMGGAGADQGSRPVLFNAPTGLQVYLTGKFTGTATFGSTTLVSQGGTDGFLCKLDAATGGLLTFPLTESEPDTQALQFGGAGSDTAVGVAIDPTGKTYVSGNFSGTADFNPGAGIANMTAPGGSSGGYFVELDAAGNYARSWVVGGIGSYSDMLLVDANDNLYAGGSFSDGVWDMDPGPGVAYLTAPNTYADRYIFKLDAAGNFAGAWHTASGSGAEGLGGFAVFDDPVEGRVFYTSGKLSGEGIFDTGTQTVTLSSSGMFVVKTIETPAVFPNLVISGWPSSTTAGTAFSFTLTIQNSSGQTMTDYAGTVHFTSTDPQAVLPADYTFTSGDQGVHTFAVTLKTAGNLSLTIAASNASTTRQIQVNPGVATHLTIDGPTSIKANTAFSITVTAYDAYGNVATGYRGTIHFSSSDSGATLPANYTFTASDSGVHTFTGLKMKNKGTRTITVTEVAGIPPLLDTDDIWTITVK